MSVRTSVAHNRISEPLRITTSTILFLPFVLFLRLIGGTWLTSNHHYPSLTQSMTLLALILGIWLIAKILSRQGLPSTGLELHLVPFLVAVFFSSVSSSNISLSAEKSLGVGLFVVFALIILDLRKTDWLWEGLINSILLTALITTLLSLISIIQGVIVYQFSIQDLLFRPDFVARALPRMPNILNLHITISAGYYLLVFPVAVFRFLRTRNFYLRVLLLLGTAASMVVFLLMQSRGSMIGLALMILAFVLLERKRIWDLIRKHRVLAAAVGIGGVALLGMGFSYILARRGFSFTEGGFLCRLEAWKISLIILQRNPFFGSGMETFGFQFLELRQSEVCGQVLHVAHNDILQILVNFGLVGFGSLLYFFFKYRALVNKNLREGKERFKVSVPALAGLAGMGLVTTMLYSPNIRFLLIVILIWMIPVRAINHREINCSGIVVLLLILMFVGAGSGWILWKLNPYFQARTAFEAGQFEEAEENLELALDRDPEITYYHQALAFIKAQHYCSTDQSLDEAIQYYETSLEQVSILPADHANLAILLNSQGSYTEAVTEMERAVELDLEKFSYYCYLGDLLIDAGNGSQAIDSLATCISGDQKWLDTPFWDALELSPAAHGMVIALAEEKIQQRPGTKDILEIGKLHYFAGNWIQASEYLESYLQENPSDYQGLTYLSLASLQQGNNQEAVDFSRRALQLNPRCQRCWLVLAEAAYQEGDLSEAENALGFSHYLDPAPGARILSAKLAIEKGDRLGAIHSVLSAPAIDLPLDKFSHWISSRWSLHTSHLSCLPAGLTYQDYYLPLTEGGAILLTLSGEELAPYYDEAMAPDRISRDYFEAQLRGSLSE